MCFTLSTGITDQVIVTAMTGPKTGAANGATGMYMYYTNTPYLKMVLHMKFKVPATCLRIMLLSFSEYLQLIVTTGVLHLC